MYLFVLFCPPPNWLCFYIKLVKLEMRSKVAHPLNLPPPPSPGPSVPMLPVIHLYSVRDTLHTGAVDRLQMCVSPPGFGGILCATCRAGTHSSVLHILGFIQAGWKELLQVRGFAGDEESNLPSRGVNKMHAGCHRRGQYSSCRLRVLLSNKARPLPTEIQTEALSLFGRREGWCQCRVVTISGKQKQLLNVFLFVPCSYLLV